MGKLTTTSSSQHSLSLPSDGNVSDDIEKTSCASAAGSINDATPLDSDDAGRPATEDEIKTLRHVRDRIPMRVWLVAIIAAAQRFTYWSTQVTWQNLIQYGPDDAIPGLLGLGQAAGVTINNAFNVVIFMLPLLIGPIADGHLGRYRTLQICNVVCLVGMALMLGFSTPPAVRAGAALPGFMVSLVLVAIGLGGVQTVTSPLIADQYNETVPKIAYRRHGRERVVIDRDMTIHYIYSIYFWLANVASLGMIPASLLEKYASFWSAYVMTTAVLALSCVVLYFGKPYFILCAPSSTVMPHTFRVLVIAARSGFRLDAALPEAQLERGSQVPWDETFIKEMRSGLMAVKVCLVWPFFRLCIGILSSSGIAQAGQMQTSGIPNNLLMAFNAVGLVVVGIVVEHGLYPFLERRRIVFGDMARIVTGLVFMAVSMAYLTMVQALIYAAPPCYSFVQQCVVGPDGDVFTGPNEVNVLVQLPDYVLVSIAEVFALVTGQAYAYKQAPANMKSMLQSIYAVFNGIGYLLAVLISPAAKNPDLVIMWASLTGVMGAATVVFWFCFRSYDRREAAE
ncbi:hypothetical protein B0T22DRAFT_378152 [Podospora appendiculata]|uniref:Peptide transporter n=1 Tax=Podospora appendiculata TaxID=314037 RepID=A0AAE1CBS9_9PEZI|nr:hypothetical protein B0T22DRAFT_378152 [Podospora appendiculata]